MKMRCRITVSLLFVLLIIGAFGKDVRIMGGRGTDIQAYPFMVSLRYANTNTIFCGGSILTPKHVLTGASCLYYEERHFGHIEVHTGLTHMNNGIGGIYLIDYVFFHPYFTGKTTTTEVNMQDVAVIMLTRTIDLNVNQYPIEIATEDVNTNDYGTLLGWGSITYPNNAFPTFLQKAQMRLFHSLICFDLLSIRLHESQFCAYNSDGVGPAFGDTGSPLVINGKLAGILSYHHSRAQGQPDIYTNVFYYSRFITDIIRLSMSNYTI